MKNVIKYLSLFLVWGIFLGIEIIFAVLFYKEATRFPVELVGPSRKEDAILAVIIITIVVFLACLVWFFVWKAIWKNQDIFESLLTAEEKENLSLNFAVYSLPLLLRENLLIINRGFSLERVNINSVIWIHTHKVIQKYRNSLMIYLYKTDGKKVKILLEYNKISLFETLLRKILSDYPQIKVTKGFFSKEYKKQKEIYKDLTRYN
ncbi:hypothetical protein [uncultured Fusobacterium sp.]|uniref:hypothetical protein n=1 Tax=uncultured Fusobacterium sp. TaxID=159267 RepID=UPI0027DE1D2B|nr:hypothetical protein [uncultured Fusobacterium sp.]